MMTLLIIVALLAAVPLTMKAMSLWYGGEFFTDLPKNHTADIELNGSQLRYLFHSNDWQDTMDLLEKMLHEASNATLKDDQRIKEIAAEIRRLNSDEVVCREEQGFWKFFVKHFNWHFTSWYPWANIRPAKVIPTHDSVDQKKLKELQGRKAKGEEFHIADLIDIPDPVDRKYLRLSWPRLVYVPRVELKNSTGVNVLTQNTQMRVWNLDRIYWKFDGKVSAETDKAIKSAFVNLLAGISMNEKTPIDPEKPIYISDEKGEKVPVLQRESFQEEDYSATSMNFFNQRLKQLGIDAVGVYPEGPFSVIEWEYTEDSQRVLDANLDKQIATAQADAVKIKAKGDAQAITDRGEAEAGVIKLKAEAAAAGTKIRAEALKDQPPATVAGISFTEGMEAVSRPGSNVKVISVGGNGVPIVYNDPELTNPEKKTIEEKSTT